MRHVARFFPYLLLGPILIPLVVVDGFYYSYLFPKVVLFYAVALFSLAAFVYLGARGEGFYFARLKNKATWIPAVLLLLAYLASVCGVDFYKSFWSIFGRGDGLLLLTLSIGTFYLILLSADSTFFKRFTHSVAVVGTLIAVWGIIEWFVLGGRIGSSIGNPAFLACYLALTFFVTLIAGFGLTQEMRRAAYGGAFLQLVAIFLTATRGTLLALLIAGVVAFLYYAVTGSEKLKKIAVGTFCVFVLISAGFYFFRDDLAKNSFTPIARIAQISNSDVNITHRLFVWEHVVQEISQKPILGYGGEHIASIFDRFYDPSIITEEWFDRSHNAYLDYAAQFGVGGAALYIALIGALFFAALRYRKRNAHIGFLLVLGTITYAIQNFFVFDTVSSWWLFLALLAVVLGQNSDASKTPFPVGRIPLFGTGVAAALLLSIIPVSVLPAIANYDLARAYYYHLIDVEKTNELIRAGLALHTYGDIEYGYQLHDMYTEQQAVRLTGQDRLEAYEMAKEVLIKNYERYPYDARTAIFLAHVLDSAPPEVSPDSAFLKGVVDRALALSPKRAQTWYVRANLSIGLAKDLPPGPKKTERYQEAIGTLEEYIALVPTISEPHYVLADLYFAIGDKERADREAAKGDLYYKENVGAARRAALYYERTQDWEKAALYLQRVVDEDETDFIFYYDLAKVNYMLGDFDDALRIVQDLRVRNPTILPTDQNFLAAITIYEQSTH